MRHPGVLVADETRVEHRHQVIVETRLPVVLINDGMRKRVVVVRESVCAREMMPPVMVDRQTGHPETGVIERQPVVMPHVHTAAELWLSKPVEEGPIPR